MLIAEFDLVSHPHLDLGASIDGFALASPVPRTFCALLNAFEGGAGLVAFCFRPGSGNVNFEVCPIADAVEEQQCAPSGRRVWSAQPRKNKFRSEGVTGGT